MSLLALLAAGQGTSPTVPGPTALPPLPSMTDQPVPGDFTDQAPYSTYLVPVETADGSGATLHPDVLDMHALFGAPVRGYRYWLSHTPFPQQDGTLENPHLAVSNNGYDWHSTAVGIENPIHPLPAGVGYQSDPDLWWNPEEKHFGWAWRQQVPGGHNIVASTSTDLLTWTPPVKVGWSGNNPVEDKSPALARIAPYQWKVWMVRGAELWRFDSTRPHQKWTGGQKCAVLDPSGQPIVQNFWHGNVLRLNDGTLIGAWSTGSGTTTGTVAGHSLDDGLTWTLGTTKLFTGSTRSYRPAFVLHDDGEHVMWWDSTAVEGSYYLHLSRVPLSVFTNPT